MSCIVREALPCHTAGKTWYGFNFNVTEVDPEGVETPVDLTGATLEVEFKRTPGGTVRLLLGEGDYTIDGEDAEVLARDPEDFDLGEGDWLVDVNVTWPNGDVDPVLLLTLEVHL